MQGAYGVKVGVEAVLPSICLCEWRLRYIWWRQPEETYRHVFDVWRGVIVSGGQEDVE